MNGSCTYGNSEAIKWMLKDKHCETDRWKIPRNWSYHRLGIYIYVELIHFKHNGVLRPGHQFAHTYWQHIRRMKCILWICSFSVNSAWCLSWLSQPNGERERDYKFTSIVAYWRGPIEKEKKRKSNFKTNTMVKRMNDLTSLSFPHLVLSFSFNLIYLYV